MRQIVWPGIDNPEEAYSVVVIESDVDVTLTTIIFHCAEVEAYLAWDFSVAELRELVTVIERELAERGL